MVAHCDDENPAPARQMLRLIIKGTDTQANAAAMDHDVHLTSMREHNPVGDMIETIATTETPERVVARWFIQAPHKAPYAVGTLLWYGHERASKIR